MIMTTFACLLAVTAAGADGPEQIPLWPKGAPGFESRKDEPVGWLGLRRDRDVNPSLFLSALIAVPWRTSPGGRRY